MDPETVGAGEASLGADAPGSDDGDDGGDDNVDEANDPELTAEREPDVPSDPDAQ
jgi:hypothetical protein